MIILNAVLNTLFFVPLCFIHSFFHFLSIRKVNNISSQPFPTNPSNWFDDFESISSSNWSRNNRIGRERKRSNIIFPSMIPYPSPRMIEGATFLPYFFFSITSSLCKILYSCKRGGGMSCIEYKIGFSLSNAFWPCNIVRFTKKFELLDNWNWKLWGHWQLYSRRSQVV